ncbi:hypothetical protein [Alloactinosynnema sp. L-07]|uniref:hypothetical protein n=1 Tax=Alloactinosynnema sp. L-07 TaxID=1653480 RepID=UPI0012F8E173|nr:hypothetical protein [Alloactinosynnema sp. L-07]
MSRRSRRLVRSYLALVQRDGLSAALIGPEVGGHGAAERIRGILESTDEYYADPLSGLSTLQDVLDQRVAEVEAAARSMGLRFDARHVLTALYPLGDVNAWGAPANSGDLILVSRGALGLTFLTLKINMMSAQMFGEPALIDRAQTVGALADVFAAHFRHGDPWRAPRLPSLTGHRAVMLDLLVNAAARFMIGHEYAHVAGRHPHVDRTTLKSADSAVEVYTRLWDDEFDADRVGAHLVLADQRLAAAAEQDPHFVRRHGLASVAAATGPMYVLLLDLVLHELDGELKVTGYPPAATAHPHPGKRWDALWPVIEQEYANQASPPPPLELPGGLMRWFENLFTDLVPAVRDRLA